MHKQFFQYFLEALFNDDVIIYGVTGSGPVEAPTVELSVAVLKLIQTHLLKKDNKKKMKIKKFYSLCLLHCMPSR